MVQERVASLNIKTGINNKNTSDPFYSSQQKNGLSDEGSEPPPIIVHGMLSASLFSAIFGTLIPGSIYRSQTIQFSAPVYCYEEVVGRVHVTKVRNLRGGALVHCDTTVTKRIKQDLNLKCDEEETRCIFGRAEVWLPGILEKMESENH